MIEQKRLSFLQSIRVLTMPDSHDPDAVIGILAPSTDGEYSAFSCGPLDPQVIGPLGSLEEALTMAGEMGFVAHVPEFLAVDSQD